MGDLEVVAVRLRLEVWAEQGIRHPYRLRRERMVEVPPSCCLLFVVQAEAVAVTLRRAATGLLTPREAMEAQAHHQALAEAQTTMRVVVVVVTATDRLVRRGPEEPEALAVAEMAQDQEALRLQELSTLAAEVVEALHLKAHLPQIATAQMADLEL